MEGMDMLVRGADGMPRVKTMDEILADQQRLQQGALPPMPAEEANSLLGNIAGAGLGALHYVGTTLDKTFGGRSVRGLLAGKPRELLAPLPFSDTLGITDPKDITTGRELLEKANVLKPKEPGAGFQWDDLAGIGTELALDPSMYLTGPGRALTQLGQKAEKAVANIIPTRLSSRVAGLAKGSAEARELSGAMGVPLAEVTGKPLGGLLGFGLPFQKPAFTVGTGPVGKTIADFIGNQADKLIYSQAGRALSRLFDPTAGNFATEAAQRGSRAIEPSKLAGDAAAKAEFMAMGKPLEQAGVMHEGEMMRGLMENTHQGAHDPVVKQAADTSVAANARMIDEARALGRDVKELPNYASRQIVPPAVDSPGFSGGYRKGGDVTTAQMKHRLEVLTNVPGESGTLNRMSMDQALMDELDKAATTGNYLNADAMIRQHMGMGPVQEAEWKARSLAQPTTTQPGYHPAPNPMYTPEWLPVPPGSPPGTQAVKNPDWLKVQEWTRIHKKAEDLRGFYDNLDRVYAREQVPMFGNHPLADQATYMINHNRAQSMAHMHHDVLSEIAGTAKPGEATVSLPEALKAVGLNYNSLGGTGPGGAALAASGAEATMLKTLIAKEKLLPGATLADMAKIQVPADVVTDLARAHQVVGVPESLQGLVGVFDSVTNLFKAMTTSPFPAFGARNALQGVWQQAAGLGLSPGRIWQSYVDSAKMVANEVVPGSAKRYFPGQKITDIDATRLLHENLFEHSARTGLGGTLVGETIGRSPAATQPLLPKLPGTGGEVPLSDVLKGQALGPAGWFGQGSVGDVAGAWSPFNVRGTGGAAGSWNPLETLSGPLAGGALKAETTNPYMRYAESVNHAMDNQHRMAGALGLMAEGYNPATAALKSKAAHYDYSKLTDFEREVMRRIVPFYNWSRQNIPYQMAQVLNHPGGLTGSAIKAGDAIRSQASFIPPAAAEGTAIPIGAENPEGTQRFLTNLGLPFEDAFSMMGTGPNAAGRTLEKLVGMTNPLIKAPIEMVAGKQMYSGRQLDDLYSRTGLGVTADQILMNSPISRALTTGGQLIDPRKDLLTKALLLGGPAKVTDIDADKARQQLGKQVLEQTLDLNKGVSSFQKLYVKPENMGMLSPEEQRLYQLYQYLDREARRAADAKKKAQVK